MNYSDLYPHILPHIPQASEPLVEQAVRIVVRDFCKQTEVIQIVSSPRLDRVAGREAYSLTNPAGMSITRVTALWDEDRKLENRSADQLTREAQGGPRTFIVDTRAGTDIASLFGDPWETAEGNPQFFFQLLPHVFRLVPIPTTDLAEALEATVALQPDMKSTGIVDFVGEDWYETLIAGALGKMFAIPEKAWTSEKLAAFYNEEYAGLLADAKSDQVAGYVDNQQATGRVRAYP